MIDGCGRTIDYLRVSVTDRCNLRCQYCMPGDVPFVPHPQILSFEEIQRMVGILCGLGIRHLRVTGGEPLVRKGCVDLLAKLHALPGVETMGLTTNGVLLQQHIPALKTIALDAVNISLDTLDGALYHQMTGADQLSQVLEGMEAALAAGLHVKLNCVVMKGVNEDAPHALVKLAETRPLDVRFIELMPLDAAKAFSYLPSQEILNRLRASYPDLAPCPAKGPGPATYYESKALVGKVGFISALSEHFCGSCNRLRLSSQGFLKLCLFHEDGVDLRGLARSGASDEAIAKAIVAAIAQKPREHGFGRQKPGPRSLSGIGG